MEGISEAADILSAGLLCLSKNDPRADNIITPRFDKIVTLLNAYINEIEKHNPAYGLVGTSDRRGLVLRHVLDSLSPLGIFSRFFGNDNATHIAGGKIHIADVGSGAGLPGIPLAIVLPEARFTLIERGGRKAKFLRNTQKTLGLANITVEEAEMEKAKPGRFSIVTFRAFRPLDPKIFKKLSRLCVAGNGVANGAVNSVLAAYKGRHEKITAEMTALENVVPGLAGRWEVLPCPVPGLDEERHLVLIYP